MVANTDYLNTDFPSHSAWSSISKS